MLHEASQGLGEAQAYLHSAAARATARETQEMLRRHADHLAVVQRGIRSLLRDMVVTTPPRQIRAVDGDPAPPT